MERKPKRQKVAGSGRVKKAGKKVGLRLAIDVIDILKQQKNQTDYLEDAVREKHSRELKAGNDIN
ncbi:hypothetical protein [Spirosoma fluminis]